ncbi:dipeptide ABC transporter ATP-binding protein [Nocardia sp. NPDC058379]|uniref:dipeptide ABC transporter ATP-binding protein n=1 Tax=unclassified Nocardia TaxID=2637762 RepID=UPI00365C41AC
MSEQHPLLRIENLSVRYRTRGTDGGHAAVEGVSLTVRRGEFVSIVGESGSGKSTTIHAALHLLPATARVTASALALDGHDIAGWTDRRLARLRGPFVGFVPQDPGTSLNPVKRVGVQVLEALRLHRRVDSGTGRELAVAKLAAAGLRDPDRVYRQYPHELSGGMKQRVLIAIALANDPALLVADEPTSALDVTVQKVILDHLAHLRDTLGLGVLLVTHDLGVAAERSDRLIVMQHGRVVEEGRARSVLNDPRQEYTRELVAAAPSRDSRRLTGTGSAATVAPTALLRLRGLRKTFPRGVVRAVDDVSLTVRAGTTHALVGESGAGKSTVARIAAGFAAPDAGEVWFDGDRIDGLSRARLRPIRREIQFVHQNPYSSLDPKFTVAEIVGEPLAALRLLPRGPQRQARVRALLDEVALSREQLRRRPAELSGGQRQRVAIARALAAGPRLLVLDEAVSALDVSVQAQILRLLADLQHEQGLTYLFITHDLGVVRLIADEVTVLRAGAVVESGPVTQVFDAPSRDYTRRLLDAVPAGTPEPREAAVARTA